MSLGTRLQELDARLVPRAAAGLAGLLDDVDTRRDEAVPALLATLSHRRVALLLAGLVLLSCGGLALGRPGTGPAPARTADPAGRAGSPTELGPAPGTDIAAYVAQNRAGAAVVARMTPGAVYTGLVSFSSYLTPAQVRSRLGSLTVHKVVLHARLPEAAVLPIAVTDLVADTRAAYADVAARRAQDQRELAALAAAARPQTAADRAAQVVYLASAEHAGDEAAAYRGDCACIIGALVRGTARDLAALPVHGAVRTVELGGTPDEAAVQIRPLLPEQHGVVSGGGA